MAAMSKSFISCCASLRDGFFTGCLLEVAYAFFKEGKMSSSRKDAFFKE